MARSEETAAQKSSNDRLNAFKNPAPIGMRIIRER
jgi:hypothetical protein